MDKIIRRIVEAGLIKKWMDDVMQTTMNKHLQLYNSEGSKALMNMKKFSGALIALSIGYVLSIITLAVELIYFYYFTIKNPYYNKYSRQIQIKHSISTTTNQNDKYN